MVGEASYSPLCAFAINDDRVADKLSLLSQFLDPPVNCVCVGSVTITT